MLNKLFEWFFSFVTPEKVKKLKIAFNKEENGLWYVDLPEWKGSHYNLLLVEGCDELMDYILIHDVHNITPYNPNLYKPYIGRLEFDLITSEHNEYHNHIGDIILEKIKDNGYGATYKVRNCGDFNREIWICPVTLYIFGEYPKYIYGRLRYNEALDD